MSPISYVINIEGEGEGEGTEEKEEEDHYFYLLIITYLITITIREIQYIHPTQLQQFNNRKYGKYSHVNE